MDNNNLINEIMSIMGDLAVVTKILTFDRVILQSYIFEYDDIPPSSLKKICSNDCIDFRTFLRNRVQALYCLLYSLVDDESTRNDICTILEQIEIEVVHEQNNVADLSRKRKIKDFIDSLKI